MPLIPPADGAHTNTPLLYLWIGPCIVTIKSFRQENSDTEAERAKEKKKLSRVKVLYLKQGESLIIIIEEKNMTRYNVFYDPEKNTNNKTFYKYQYL